MRMRTVVCSIAALPVIGPSLARGGGRIASGATAGLVVALFLLVLAPAPTLGQTGQITGTVSGEAGQPLAGVSVTIPGTDLGQLTDENGRFLLVEVPAGAHQVEATRIGYAPLSQAVTVTADETTVVEFVLDLRALELDAIVAVGYGTQRRDQITTAVATVTADEFAAGPTRDAGSLIAGKLAGLAVNTPTGDPTEETQIMLRGVTTIQGSRTPLVLIDGTPGDLDLVAPQDIESITVLKDGSAAAIYGSRASNGVILITTRQHAGGEPTLRYHAYVSQQRIYKTPDLLTAADQRRLMEEGYEFTDLGYETDWIAELTRQPISQAHTLSLSGGSTRTNYTASLNFEDTEGVFIRSDNRELTGRARIRHSMFDGRLDAELSLLSRTQTYFSGPDFDWAWQQAVIRNPLDAPRNEDGSWRQTSTGALRYENPISFIEEHDGETERRQQRVHSTLTLTPIDRLQFSLMGGFSRENRLSGHATTHEHQDNTEGGSGGTAERRTSSRLGRILEVTGTYSDRIVDHGFTLLGGYSYQDFVTEAFMASNSRFPTDLFGYDQLQRGTALGEGIADMSSSKSDYKLIGFFGRLNYDWRNRYLLLGSVRYEGNSRFGAGHKWGIFPAVSAGWRISEEGFMDGVRFIDDLQLRAGYGVTGIAPDESYLSLTGYEYGDRILYNGEWVQGVSPSRNPNPDLRWEQKDELNIGLNFSLFDFRLSGSLDVYRRDTRDMLYEYSVPVPPNLYSSMLANVGHMRNNGIEAELSYRVVDSPGLRWTTSANWSTNSNTLVSLSDAVYQADDFFYAGHTAAPIQQTTHRVEVGGPIGDFYGYESVGIDDDGVWIVLDRDGEEISIEDATEADRHVLGNGLPKHFFAWNNTAQIGNFDLSVNMRGAADFQILNFLRLYYENPRMVEYNMLESAFDPVYGKRTVDYDLAYVSYYIEDGDYLKIDNVPLGYTFGVDALNALSGVVSSARIYVSGHNLWTFTGYEGLDPEVTISGLAPGNDDRAHYPTTRTFTAGMSFSF